MIMKRTPYGVEGSAGNFVSYLKALADEGYIFVFQDLRGKFASEGTFVMQRAPRAPGNASALDEGTDEAVSACVCCFVVSPEYSKLMDVTSSPLNWRANDASFCASS